MPYIEMPYIDGPCGTRVPNALPGQGPYRGAKHGFLTLLVTVMDLLCLYVCRSFRNLPYGCKPRDCLEDLKAILRSSLLETDGTRTALAPAQEHTTAAKRQHSTGPYLVTAQKKRLL
jgi:hypothetical protein